MRKFFILLSLIPAGFNASAQILPVKFPFLEERWRILQLKGLRDINSSFCIRPFIKGNDSLYAAFARQHGLVAHDTSGKSLKPFIKWTAVSLVQQYNSDHPYGWNDDAMIPSRGYQLKFSGGIYGKWGPVTMQLQPEFVYAQNRTFRGFSTYQTDSVWATYYSMVLNKIDAPDKFGHGAYTKLLPGQSNIRINYKKLSLGVSTENLWWGPGERNSLLMSNNAPGFEHISFNTTSPIISGIGTFEWQIVAGILKNSSILPPDTGRTLNGQKLYDPKNNADRYINGMVITWQPKWIKGLHLGLARVFYQYRNNISSSLNGWLPVFSAFFKGNSQSEDAFGRDQMLSVFFRLILPNDNAEVYAEFGRNDHSQNINDLVMEPEHSGAYLFGGKKLFKNNRGTDIVLMSEFAHLQSPSTITVRESNTWYTHHQVRQGYTNRGEVMGAGIGPGSNSQTIGLTWIKEKREYGGFLERVVRNNDFYYAVFAGKHNFGSHWVDMSLNSHYSFVQKRLLYSANLSYIYTYNYQWKYDNGNSALQGEGKTNVGNVHASLAISYLF